MLVIVFIASIIGASLNATSSVMQRVATHVPDSKRLYGHSFFYEMVKSRLFIFGFVLQAIAFLLQAVALKYGPLTIVEPIMSLDIVFFLLLIHFKLKIHIKFADWLAVLAIIIGLSGLFLATNPSGGTLEYKLKPWIILISILGTIIVLIAISIRQIRNSKLRAFLAALAAASSFALNAAFIKLSFNLYNRYGLHILITSWPIYALIISGIFSIYLMVNAYGAGPLSISQTVIGVSEPAISVLIGVLIFSEGYSTSTTSLIFGSICSLIIIYGIISLAISPRLQLAGEKGI